MDLQLTGKVILVTGATSGIGLATARLLAAEGAHVAALARGGSALPVLPPGTLLIRADLTDPGTPAHLPRGPRAPRSAHRRRSPAPAVNAHGRPADAPGTTPGVSRNVGGRTAGRTRTSRPAGAPVPRTRG
ncbi:SDR family NAD(P)-dependent oxidoreductase [Microbispora sp. NPDC088329]|uniref:SDR family NAD(P)-dependent oxidoreductase n=1 Tax=Microbispora sp. NPDC088329 TaxID=3154869 RepID=UPI00341278AB